MYKSFDKGRSMIEMLGVLAIIGVLSVGGIAGYSKAMSSFKHNKWRQQVEDLIFNIKDAYKNEKTYGNGNLLPTMQSIGIVPQDMLNEGNVDLFGNKVSIKSRGWNGYVRMNLLFEMIPNKESVRNCHDLLQMVSVYTNYIWTVSVCTGNGCEYTGPFIYRACGKVAPAEYVQETKCKDYDFAEVMQACRVCAEEPCSALVLFDNNA